MATEITMSTEIEIAIRQTIVPVAKRRGRWMCHFDDKLRADFGDRLIRYVNHVVIIGNCGTVF
jgi:hypothetical protein